MSTNETLIKQIEEAQKSWGDGLVEIGKEKLAIEQFVKDHYYFEKEKNEEGKEEKEEKEIFKALFKPTLTSFVTSNERVIAYFKDFAQDPRIKKVWFNNYEMFPNINGDSGKTKSPNMVVINGVYNFLTSNNVITAEYSFVYYKNEENKSCQKWKILLQHSSLPVPV